MTAPTTPLQAAPTRRPAAAWLLVPLAVWVVSLVLLGVGGLGLYRALGSDPALLDPGDRVVVGASGLAVWRDAEAPGDDPGCRLTRAGREVALERGEGTRESGSVALSLVGTAPGDLPHGTWVVACDERDAALYVTRDANLPLAVLTAVGSVLLFLGAVVLATVLVLRRRRTGPHRPAGSRTPPDRAWAPGIPS